MQSVITTHDFFSLSSFLNYQLSGSPINWRGVLTFMCSERLSPTAEEHLLDTLIYLGEAYGQQKRRLGPFAILHPIRTAALLSKASNVPTTLDLLTTLLHDKDEDITENRYSNEDWNKLEDMYHQLITRIASIENWYLNERIHFLARKKEEKYHEYLSRLIKQSRITPELIRVKLADRLDNTLDLRMDLYEDMSGIEFYQVIFEAFFVNTYKGPAIKTPHNTDRKINGAMRLYELYKNAVFLSLLHSENIELDEPAQKLFNSLSIAGINEAQNIMLHIFTYHIGDPQRQKTMLTGVMNYCKDGCLRFVSSDKKHRLDGLLKNSFDHENKDQLIGKLNELYNDKELMAEAAVAFAAVFINFLNDKDFVIEGI